MCAATCIYTWEYTFIRPMPSSCSSMIWDLFIRLVYCFYNNSLYNNARIMNSLHLFVSAPLGAVRIASLVIQTRKRANIASTYYVCVPATRRLLKKRCTQVYNDETRVFIQIIHHSSVCSTHFANRNMKPPKPNQLYPQQHHQQKHSIVK